MTKSRSVTVCHYSKSEDVYDFETYRLRQIGVADVAKRKFDDQFPKHATLRKAALEYILSEKSYLGSDFVKAIAVKLAITPEQLALPLPRKRNRLLITTSIT